MTQSIVRIGKFLKHNLLHVLVLVGIIATLNVLYAIKNDMRAYTVAIIGSTPDAPATTDYSESINNIEELLTDIRFSVEQINSSVFSIDLNTP